jgi:Ribonuclease G/E
MGQIVTQKRVHWDEVETSREQCPECHGSGRMVRHEKVWFEVFGFATREDGEKA